jgi:hypothetical protein
VNSTQLCLSLLATAGLAGFAQAAEIQVTQDIAVSTTWTKNNTYNLKNQIYVLPGATLTIEAGTIVASDVTPNGGGSLAVCAGAQIFVLGTEAEPVVMTSKADVATWTGGNPKTGVYRQSANEWGNLTIMGNAYISEDQYPGNVGQPNPNNRAVMEGLTAQFPGDTRVLYGGGNDDDDSGTIQYLSLRYGGRVVGLANELNGLSLGGIGRGTDIRFVEIMNNVDDGIEIWGGTVNLKNFVIWNIGDDSLDVDQGWRGKAQFGLIVKGYSVAAAQGSGVGDNAIEADGAEQSHYQPVTTSALYNITVIGQPGSTGSDHGVAYRDGARLQVRNSIFMDLGERLVGLDNVDGDGGLGYGHSGTLTWAQTWTTPFNAVPAHPNDAPAGLAGWAGYPAQSAGFLNDMRDNVFFRNLNAQAYTEANNVGVLNAANNNVVASNMPIRGLTRAPAQNVFGALVMQQVTFLDPRAANDALTSVATAPNDGFFTPVQYRGAFGPHDNWAREWTAADAYGFFGPGAKATVRPSIFGANVPNSISAVSKPSIGNPTFAIRVNDPAQACVTPIQAAILVLDFGGPANIPIPGWGCGGGLGEVLVFPTPSQLTFVDFWFGTPVTYGLPIPNLPGLVGLNLNTQSGFYDIGTGDIRLGWALDLKIGL